MFKTPYLQITIYIPTLGLKKGTATHTVSKTDKCKRYPNIPQTDDTDDTTVTNQGLGETLTLDQDRKKLVICAPRHKSRDFSFCEMSDRERLSNVRGICYEIDIDNNDVLLKTHDYCRESSEWQSVKEIDGGIELQAFQKDNVCLQLRHASTSAINDKLVFHLEDGGTKVLAIKYSFEKGMFELTIGSQEPVQVSCEPNSLAIGLLVGDKLRFYCNGKRASQDFELSLGGSLKKTTLEGPSEYWAEGFQSFRHLLNHKNNLLNLDTCMLGYSARYDPDNILVLSAPGYDRYTYPGSYGGSLFFGEVFMEELSNGNDVEQITEKGLMFRSLQFGSTIWAVISGVSREKSAPNRGVMILRNKLFHSLIADETPLTGFGAALLLWKSDTILQLVVSAPFSAHHDQLDCGVLYIYTFQNSQQFQLEHSIRGACGGFGATIEDIGDLDGDGFSDVAVGAVYDNSLHIIMGTSNGLQTSISQTIKPQELLQGYVNMFGFAVSGHDGVVAVSDPMFNKVYIYTTLDVLELSTDITCGDVLDIDADNNSVNCEICYSLLSRGSNSISTVNITVSWMINNKHVIERKGGLSEVISYLTDESCVNLEFLRRSDIDIRSFDITNDLEIRFSFSQGPDPETGRIAAIAPETLTEEIRVIETTSVCGHKYCEADFDIKVDWGVERWEQTEMFEVISDKVEIQDKTIYHGSGKEALIFNVTVEIITGRFIDEILVLDLGKDFAVRYSVTNCNDFIQRSKILLDVTKDTGLCSATIVQCDEGSYLMCKILGESDNTKKVFQLQIPVILPTYTVEEMQLNLALKTVRNKELDSQNNALTTVIPIINVLNLEVSFALQPPEQKKIHLRDYRSKSSTLQGYGPEQTLLIQFQNRGTPTVQHIEVSVLYPVNYKGEEMIYINNLTITTKTFNCTLNTDKAINYRKLTDVYEKDTETKLDELNPPSLVRCSNNWMCVNLVCSLQNIRQNKAAYMTVDSYLNAEAASVYSNISFTISYTTKILDSRSLAIEKMKFQEIKSIVKVIKTASALWYIIGSVVGGSILLVLLTLVLLRCGFFTRKDREQVRLLRNTVVRAAVLTSVAEVTSIADHTSSSPGDKGSK